MPLLTLLGLAALLWLFSWAVIRHQGWAWLPAAASLASLYLLNRVERQITHTFAHLSDLLIFLVSLAFLLFLTSKLKALELRVGVTSLLLPLLFSVSFYVVVNAVIGRIG